MPDLNATRSVLQLTDEENDAAKRLAEAVNRHVSTSPERQPGFIAVRLADGRSVDNVLYDSRKDAVRHNRDDRAVFYVKIGADSMPLREAAIVLQLNRMAYKRGVIFAEEEPLAPMQSELMLPLMPRTMTALGYANRAARRHPRG